MTRSIDVTGLSDDAIAAVEQVVAVLKKQSEPARLGGTVSFPSRAEWIRAVREWAASHPQVEHFVDDSRESIYTDRGE
jgi:hypothetical protein